MAAMYILKGTIKCNVINHGIAHYKFCLFESIQLWKQMVYHMFHSDMYTKVDLWPPKRNLTNIHCNQVVCEAAQPSPTYNKKWELGNGLSTIDQI